MGLCRDWGLGFESFWVNLGFISRSIGVLGFRVLWHSVFRLKVRCRVSGFFRVNIGFRFKVGV